MIAIDLSKQQVPDVAPKAALRFFISEYQKKGYSIYKFQKH